MQLLHAAKHALPDAGSSIERRVELADGRRPGRGIRGEVQLQPAPHAAGQRDKGLPVFRRVERANTLMCSSSEPILSNQFEIARSR